LGNISQAVKIMQAGERLASVIWRAKEETIFL
jgi:hypothetical protein